MLKAFLSFLQNIKAQETLSRPGAQQFFLSLEGDSGNWPDIDEFKQHFINYLRQIDTQSLSEKILSVKKIEQIDPDIQTLFVSFCQQYNLPFQSTT